MVVGVKNFDTPMKICDTGEFGTLFRRKSGEFFTEAEDGRMTVVFQGRFGESIWRYMDTLFPDDEKFTNYWMSEELVKKLRQDKERQNAD